MINALSATGSRGAPGDSHALPCRSRASARLCDWRYSEFASDSSGIPSSALVSGIDDVCIAALQTRFSDTDSRTRP